MTTSTTSTTTTTAASTGYSALTSSSSGTGIDYSTLIEAKVEAKLEKADTIDAQITENEAKIAAYETLQTDMTSITDALEGLRNRTTSTGGSTNLFNQREAYLTGGGSTGASNILGISDVEDGTETGTYSVVVEQLATKNKIGGMTTSDTSTELGLSGSFSLSSTDGTSATISIESTDSLSDVATKINAQSSTTGVSASLLKVDDDTYELVLSTTSTGQTISISDGGDGVTASLGLTESDGVTAANELQAGNNAIVTIDGVTYTRSSNTIDDAIDGVTIDLYSAEAGDTVTLEISTDLSAISDALTEFVDAYNQLVSDLDTYTATDSSGAPTDDAALYGDSIERQIENLMSSLTGSTVKNADGDTLTLADIGITLGDDGTLTLDEDDLATALTNNLDDVKALLGLNVTTSDSGLSLLRDTSSTTSFSFDLDITMNSDGTVSSASVGGDTSAFTVSGNRITGAEGTAYEGLVFVYTGSGGTVSVDLTSGIADQAYSSLDEIADDSDGTIQDQIDDLSDVNDTLETKSDTIKEKAETYRTRLTNYYAELEAKAETANLLLQYLNYDDSEDD